MYGPIDSQNRSSSSRDGVEPIFLPRLHDVGRTANGQCWLAEYLFSFVSFLDSCSPDLFKEKRTSLRIRATWLPDICTYVCM